MTNFFDKEMYVRHYENLKLYLRPGLKLKKLHHVLKLNQSQWLKLYTELKKNKSRKNGDKDGKVLYKLMSNAKYGKTMESLRKRIDAQLVNKK